MKPDLAVSCCTLLQFTIHCSHSEMLAECLRVRSADIHPTPEAVVKQLPLPTTSNFGCRPGSDIRTADQCQAADRPTPDHQYLQYAAAKSASSIPIRTTTFQKPDVALAFFYSARHASTGAGSRFRAKGGIGPKALVPTVFPLSALSVLCFCERRLSHYPLDKRGFPAASMKSNSGVGGDRLNRPGLEIRWMTAMARHSPASSVIRC